MGLTKAERAQRELAQTTMLYENMAALSKGGFAIGIDEVGRGCLAGPVCVGAVVLPAKPYIVGIDDSKKLSPKRREKLAATIRSTALAAAVAYVEASVIDEIGIQAALVRAMLDAAQKTGYLEQASAVLIDGNPLHIFEHEQAIVKGDGKVACIAAASIYAKVERDAYMSALGDGYSKWPFAASKGYGTAAHIEAIKRYGLCDLHRRSFCTHFV